MKRVIVESTSNAYRAAILKGQTPIAFFSYPKGLKEQAGDLVMTRVDQYVPSIGGLFVTLPSGAKALLPKTEWPPSEGELGELEKGSLLLLQIKREKVKQKQALVTRNVQIKGKSLIYLPYGNYLAVSHRLSPEQQSSIKARVTSFLTPPDGLIVRAHALERHDDELKEEWEALKTEWGSIQEMANYSSFPCDLTSRKTFSEELSEWLPSDLKREWWTNDTIEAQGIKRRGEEVHLVRTKDLFDASLNKEWKQANQPIVYLKPGLSIVIEETEALTAIDVNTGTFKGGASKAQTAFEGNKLAVKEIARQLALRQLGGIILIDLLKMDSEEDREVVLQTFEEALNEDFTTTFIAGYTKLGLLELTRKKTKYGLFCHKL